MKAKSYVSRAVYQKVKEENKRLTRYLRIICMEPGVEAILLRAKLRDEFKKADAVNKAITEALKPIARQFFKDHPELSLENYIKNKNDGKNNRGVTKGT